MVRTPENESLIKDIDAGIKKKFPFHAVRRKGYALSAGQTDPNRTAVI